MRKWTLLAVLLLAGCSDDDMDPTGTSPGIPSPTPSPTPAATPTPTTTSPYAGNWAFRTTLTAVDRNCGHTPADVGMAEGPFAVTVASNGSFALPGGSEGTIDAAGNVSLNLGPAGGACSSGSGAGGCRNTDHCDGTSVQAGDVKRWMLDRQWDAALITPSHVGTALPGRVRSGCSM
jgi:hypothetical protein